MKQFKEEVDKWIKDFNRKQNQLERQIKNFNDLPKMLINTLKNNEHTYQILMRQQKEIQALNTDLELIKTIQIQQIKQKRK